MSKERRFDLSVGGAPVSGVIRPDGEYISLTDMAQAFEGGSSLIEQWLRSKDTILFLAAWERLNNTNFNSLEFEGISGEAGRNSFFLSVKKWIDSTNAQGIFASAGRYGGTYAHRDIAFEFGTWLSPEFKLYLIKEFQRLKEDEARRQSLDWNLNRTLSKLNYRIHTDAIKECIVPQLLSGEQERFIYADEADILNVALFGKTARQWREENPQLAGNMRDHAHITQLLVLVNLESMNAQMIREGLPPSERLKKLNAAAIQHLKSLGSVTLGPLDRSGVLPFEED